MSVGAREAREQKKTQQVYRSDLELFREREREREGKRKAMNNAIQLKGSRKQKLNRVEREKGGGKQTGEKLGRSNNSTDE